MNPLLREALESAVRSVLKVVAGYLVARGVWSDAAATTYVLAAATAIVGFGWSLWRTYRTRIFKVVALSSPPGTSEATVDRVVATQSLATNLTMAVMPKT